MKQHITKEQFDELEDKEKEAYYEYSSSSKGLGVVCRKETYYKGAEKEKVEYRVPLWNIGQMIEFLGDDLGAIFFDKEKNIVRVDHLGENGIVINNFGDIDYKYEERLCNILWEACKYKLIYG